MKKTVQYKTIQERNQLILDNSTLILIEERNISDGNFLIFSDVSPGKEVVYTQVPEQEFNTLQNTQSQISSDFQGLTDLLAELGVI